MFVCVCVFSLRRQKLQLPKMLVRTCDAAGKEEIRVSRKLGGKRNEKQTKYTHIERERKREIKW